MQVLREVDVCIVISKSQQLLTSFLMPKEAKVVHLRGLLARDKRTIVEFSFNKQC